MFSKGQIIFAAVFAVVFAGVLIWSYRRDRKVNSLHFRKAYKVLIAIVLFILLQFVIVKLGGFI